MTSSLNGPWQVPEPGCPGFAWIGQAVTACDQCGDPIWEHEFVQEIDREKGPFVPNHWVYRPISQKTKDFYRNAYLGKQAANG